MLRNIPTVGIVALYESRVLLVRHGDTATHITGVYGLPAGKINPGEKAIDAAMREFTEETGLVTTLEHLHTYPNNHYRADIETKMGETVTYPFEVFYCAKFTGALRETDEATPVWVELKNIVTLQLLPNVAKAIDDVQRYLKKREQD